MTHPNAQATCRLDRVAQHPVICLTPGLFGWAARPRELAESAWALTKSQQRPPETWTLAGPEPLSYLDGRLCMVLTGLVHGSQRERLWVGPAPKSDLGRAIRQALGCADGVGFYAAKTSLGALAREAGYTPSPQMSRQIRAGLDRLQATAVTVATPTGTTHSRLVGVGLTDDYRHPLLIALNPWISDLQDYESGVRYVALSLQAMRTLVGVSEAAVRLYWRLAGWVNGPPRRVSLPTLIEYAWGPVQPKSDRSLRYRRAETQAAVLALRAIGWSVEAIDGQIYQVSRPP